jgi:hypothetical protein
MTINDIEAAKLYGTHHRVGSFYMKLDLAPLGRYLGVSVRVDYTYDRKASTL